MIPISKKDLEELLAKDLEKGLQQLCNALVDLPDHNEALTLKGRFADVSQMLLRGAVSYDEYSRQRTNIYYAAIHLLKQIPDPAPAAPAADPLADWPLPAMGYPEAPYLGFHRFEERHRGSFSAASRISD